MNAWIGFGLCATGQPTIPLQNIKNTVLRPSFGPKRVPDVVHALKPLPATFFTISGQTLDSTSAVLANCTLELFEKATNRFMEITTSNGSGYYFFKSPLRTSNYYVVAYKAGSPDVAGTTVNTLVGA